MLQDAVLTGNGFMLDGKRLDPVSVKVSSPELASLAAEYLALSVFDLAYRLSDPSSATEVKRLAASVLAQAEGNPRK